jgi:glycogen operon protein
MTDEAWHSAGHCLGVRLAGDLIEEVDEAGERIVGDTLLILLNSSEAHVPFTLPLHAAGHQRWEVVCDTADEAAEVMSEEHVERRRVQGGEPYPLQSRSLALLRVVSSE